MEEFYHKMIFFSKADYIKHSKNTALRIIELTPIALNYDYLD
jgi:hypothetical protein